MAYFKARTHTLIKFQAEPTNTLRASNYHKVTLKGNAKIKCIKIKTKRERGNKGGKANTQRIQSMKEKEAAVNLWAAQKFLACRRAQKSNKTRERERESERAPELARVRLGR